ncbi:sensor histidine kinase [Marinobacter alexandrii]|uniref:sensor histidine kinase n=1 Tax=Marinobacter alexandrii TaxID=2570351 RepID=UPI002ABD5246|nr:ATP-binding protein [Marinobacter alexandrii]
MNTPNLQQFPLDLFETPLRLICDVVPGCSKVTLRKKGFEDLVVARDESTEPLRWQLEANAPVAESTDATLILEGATTAATKPLSPAAHKSINLIGQQINLFLQSIRHQSESLALANLLESMPDAVVTCDQNGMLEQFNDIARKWHGTDPRSVPPELWSKYFDLFEADGITPLATENIPLLRAFQGQFVHGAEIAIKAHRQDLRIVSCNGSAIKDKNKIIGAIVVMHDISHARHMDQMRKRLISTVSHELRTPLTSLTGSLKLIASGVGGDIPTKAKELLAIAERSSTRLQTLVNDLLNLNKLRSGGMTFEIQQLNVYKVLDSLIAELQGLRNQRQVTICVTGNTAKPGILADDVRLRQAIANLISNAAKHSAPGSQIDLECIQGDQYVRIRVLDRGTGVPKDFVPRLFEEFTQAYDDNSTQKSDGSGLGLPICRALVEAMAGHVGYCPREGGGSEFWIDIPSQTELG